MSRAVKVGQNQ